jgi:hypothetical protein
MKTKQTKIDRSAAKWLPRAMALAATTASSQAATVQITLTGNKISSTGGDQLNADLTRDGVPDIIVYASRTSTSGVSAWVQDLGGAGGGFVSAYYTDTTFGVDARFLAGVGSEGGSGPAPRSASYLNPVTFSDPGINNGAPTGGWLQVNAFNTNTTSHTVELSRLIFDTESTTRPSFTSIPGAQTEWGAVPEPSSLGLLALGAGGLLLRRRRAAA